MQNVTTIKLDHPAETFVDAFPVGTGRIGGMVYGGAPEERISLNHEWLWSACYRGKKNPEDTADRLPELRELLRNGRYEEAGEFGNQIFSPRGGISKLPARIDAFLPAGDFLIRVPDAGNKASRTLDMEQGMVFSDQGELHREYLADLSSDLLYVRLTHRGGKPFSGSCSLNRNRQENDDLKLSLSGDTMRLSATAPGGIHFQIECRVFVRGGSLSAQGETLCFNEVTELIAVLDLDVDSTHPELQCKTGSLNAMPDWQAVLSAHLALWRRKFDSCRVTLPHPSAVLRYFNYGRYLLIASTANAELPPNLQGIWNESFNPPWMSDYHLNINLQMNYWGASPTGLGDTNCLLFRYVDRLAEAGRIAAKKIWGAEGIFLPHATDVWAQATPEAYGWSVWLGAAPWLAMHYFQYYRYTLDLDFLRDQAYPFLRDTARFFETLLEIRSGVLEILPSQSPENAFKGGGRMPVTLCISSACDVELLTELFRNAIASSEVLNCDPERRAVWRKMLDAMPPLTIGNDGRLQEWRMEVEETEPGHRHVSHLIGVYPGSVLNARSTPELFRAARKSLDFRLANYGGHTGWSQAWTANFFAAFGDGESALKSLKQLAEHQSSESLLDLHPPKIFQIDGNLGAIAAVAAMLVKPNSDLLTLLPALPSEWSDGEATGICAYDGLRIDLKWSAGKLRRAVIHAERDTVCRMVCPSGVSKFSLSVSYTGKNGLLEFPVKAGCDILWESAE